MSNQLGIQTEENQLTPDGELRQLVDHNTIQWGSYPNGTGAPGIGAGVPIPVPPPSIGGNLLAPWTIVNINFVFGNLPASFVIPGPPPAIGNSLVLAVIETSTNSPNLAHLNTVKSGLGADYSQIPAMFTNSLGSGGHVNDQAITDMWILSAGDGDSNINLTYSGGSVASDTIQIVIFEMSPAVLENTAIGAGVNGPSLTGRASGTGFGDIFIVLVTPAFGSGIPAAPGWAYIGGTSIASILPGAFGTQQPIFASAPLVSVGAVFGP